MKVANPFEMLYEFLQYILFLTSLSDDNAFGSVFKTQVYWFLKTHMHFCWFTIFYQKVIEVVTSSVLL